MDGHDDVALIPQLAIALTCLPSEILKQDYNEIENILSTFEMQARKAKKGSRK
jgi:hypothetical protein